MADSTALAVIPARYASTRLPGKPLLARTGKPMIQHVVERVLEARAIGRVVVATDDLRIAEAVGAFGGEAVMTSSEHPNGTSRIAEAVESIAAGPSWSGGEEEAIVVNVQGDEPEIEPALVDRLVEALAADREAPMATLASPFADDENPQDPNIVKVVIDQNRRALYFSRAAIPHDRDGEGTLEPLKHLGIYGYRRWFLPRYVTLAPTPLEQCEKLEQLRALEHGYPIAVVRVEARHHGIDTPEQYEAFVQRRRDAGEF